MTGRVPAAGASWLLVTGAPRSGTSLLRALLTEHPQVGLLQEYGLTRLIGRIDALVARPPAVEEDRDRPGDPADPASRFHRDRPAPSAVTRGGGDPEPEHFDAVAAGLFSGLFPGKDLKVVGDKMPIGSAWEDLPLLFSRLPGLRIVAVIRNPSDVVRSSLVRREATRRGRDSWPIRTVQEAAAQWVAAWRILVALAARRGPAVTVVKYEDLCARPQAIVDGIGAWLGLPSRPVTTPIAALPPDLALHHAAEQAALDRLLGPVIEAWATSDAGTLMTTFASLTPPCLPGEPILLSREEAAPYLVSGFSFREEWGRWTDGPHALLSIPHGVTRGLLLVEIGVLQAFRREGESCDVVVRSGWGEPKLFQLGPDASRVAFVVQAEETQEPGTLEIELLIARPKRPDEPPADGRALGILVETVTVSRLPGREPDRP